MAEGPLLTRPTKYNIEDSNIALLGSDLEKKVREHAGDKDPAWESAGKVAGTQIWRIEKFSVVEWPKTRFGSFYDGDSYIVLHTYKPSPDSEELAYNLHFWLGSETSQDEACTAAYKTVELDDHLGEKPVQYREIQGYESPKFLSYFPRFLCMKGGVATGFHHVSSPPPDNSRRLYRVTASGHQLVVREVLPEASSLVPGDAYILDMGTKVWQLNTKGSVGKERFKAAEFAHALANDRNVTESCEVTVYDEGGHGAGIFLAELGLDGVPAAPAAPAPAAKSPTLYRLSDASGKVSFESVEPVSRASLSSSDASLLDDTANPTAPAVYVWIGKDASLGERRLAPQYAQYYLYSKGDEGRGCFAANIVKMKEGRETEAFLRILGA
ncbi:fragmin60 [Phanerochaete sordida]|uniref:Fragmin60 n=1 Tax=Phanerochaete sordida TaxID=48140 RepID=A0A9P3G537_9APHY|nr:fragmin60 [Phanerochaete sordida]